MDDYAEQSRIPYLQQNEPIVKGLLSARQLQCTAAEGYAQYLRTPLRLQKSERAQELEILTPFAGSPEAARDWGALPNRFYEFSSSCTLKKRAGNP